MQSYSTDVRHQIGQAYERRLGSQRALADLFGGSGAFVEQLLHRHRSTGTVAPKPHAGGQPRRLGAAAATRIRDAVHAPPALTLEALCARGADTQGIQVSGPTMGRARQRLKLPRKKSGRVPLACG